MRKSAYLLIEGSLPTTAELESFTRELGERRTLPADLVTLLRAYPRSMTPVGVLQSVVPAMVAHDPGPSDPSKEAERERAVDLTAKLASLVAAWHRIRMGLDPVPSDPSLGHAADFLRMLHDATPDPRLARELDIALILHADHSMNASTFTARTVTSTRATIYAAVSAAIGALSGELHGGANAKVMEMLEEIGDLDQVEPYVRSRLESGGRIMGMGHAVYRTDDPRAVILREMSRRAGPMAGEPHWFALTERVEEVTRSVFRERKGQGDLSQCRPVLSVALPGDGHPPRSLHPGVRGGSGGRLVGPRDRGAVRRSPGEAGAVPAAIGVRRPLLRAGVLRVRAARGAGVGSGRLRAGRANGRRAGAEFWSPSLSRPGRCRRGRCS